MCHLGEKIYLFLRNEKMFLKLFSFFRTMSKKTKKTYFQESWLTNSEFKERVGDVVDNKTQAKCNLCKAAFS